MNANDNPSAPPPHHLQTQLALLHALDRIRDTLEDDGDPGDMFQSMVGILREHFKADACGLVLTAGDILDEQMIFSTGISVESARPLALAARECPTPQALVSENWPHILGLRIWLDWAGKTPGGFFLARRNIPFSAEDIELLTTAESQIDSAVVQAQTIWKLAERNRELEAIYQIDRLRDDTPDEDALLMQLSAILLEHFRGQLALINTIDSETHEPTLRHLIDKLGLPGTGGVLQSIQSWGQELEQVESDAVSAGQRTISVLGAPLQVAGVQLGFIIIGRERPFKPSERHLMRAIVSQIDSAIAKNRVAQQLSIHLQELEAIYSIDRIRDQEHDFDAMMQAVLVELCKAVSSETGYIMLYNASEESQLELRATTRDGVLTREDYFEAIEKYSRQALALGAPILVNEALGPVRSLIATPLILNERIIGVFGALNSTRARGFNKDDQRMLTAITSQVDTAIFERLERRRMRQVLSRSVDPKVLERLLERTDASMLAGERVEISVIFADLRGSTEWAMRTKAEELVLLLNTFLGLMTDIIFKHGGTLDKFVGDEVIALFGTPVHMKDHAYHAAQAAVEMQMVHGRLRAEIAAQGREIPPMGIGISSGEVIAGEFGPPLRTDFTAMGPAMNLGSRLCSTAKGGQIIISQHTYELLGAQCRATQMDSVTLKGFGEPIAIYQLDEVY